jgi:signal transduction histidine kinase
VKNTFTPAPRPISQIIIRLIQLPLILVVFILLLFGIYQSYAASQAMLHEQSQTVESVKEASLQYFEQTRQIMFSLGRMMATSATDEEKAALLHDLRLQYPRFQAFYYLNADGIVQFESVESFSLIGLDLSNEEFYKSIMEIETSPSMYTSQPYVSLGLGKMTVTIAKSVMQNDKLVGTLVGEMDLSYIQNIIDETAKNTTNSIGFILDTNSNIVAHPNRVWVEEQRNLGHLPFEELAKSSQVPYTVYLEENQWVLASVSRLDNGWIAVTTRPLWQALTPIFLATLFTLGGLFISFFVFNLTKTQTQQLIVEPIARLTLQANALTNNPDKTLTIPTENAFDEVHSLSLSFRRMIKAVQERSEQLQAMNIELGAQALQRARAEAEVRSANAKLEERVQERTAQLESANRELESFSYSVSHDLRAPLRGIAGYSQILQEDYANVLDEQGKAYLQNIRSSAQHMGHLIESLLKLSRVTRADLHFQTVDLSEQATHILRELKLSAPNRVLQLEIQPNLSATGDPNLLRAMLENLLGNAWKFTAHTPEAHIFFGKVTLNDKEVFSIQDNGAGFDMKFSGKLFGAFQRLHHTSEFEGTGIGLATVERIIRRHDGEIWAEGTPGEGAKFYFTLPERGI